MLPSLLQSRGQFLGEDAPVAVPFLALMRLRMAGAAEAPQGIRRIFIEESPMLPHDWTDY